MLKLHRTIATVLFLFALSMAHTWRPPPPVDESAGVLALIRPPEFFAPTLLAQPNRAAINLVAPYRVTVGVAAVQLTTSGNVHGIVVKALASGQTIYLGVSSAVTTSTGWPLAHYETLTLEVRNANTLWAIASAAAQSVAVLPFSRH